YARQAIFSDFPSEKRTLPRPLQLPSSPANTCPAGCAKAGDEIEPVNVARHKHNERELSSRRVTAFFPSGLAVTVPRHFILTSSTWREQVGIVQFGQHVLRNLLSEDDRDGTERPIRKTPPGAGGVLVISTGCRFRRARSDQPACRDRGDRPRARS